MPADDETDYQQFLIHHRRAHEEVRLEEVQRWWRGQLQHEMSDAAGRRFWACLIGIPAAVLIIITIIWGP